MNFNEENDRLALRPSNLLHTIEILITNNYNEIKLPPRSELIRQIKILIHNNDILIPNQEVDPEVFIPNILVESNTSFIRFLNTNDSIIIIKQNKIKKENVSDYNVVTQETNKHQNGQSKVMNILKKNFPEQFKSTLSGICKEYRMA